MIKQLAFALFCRVVCQRGCGETRCCWRFDAGVELRSRSAQAGHNAIAINVLGLATDATKLVVTTTLDGKATTNTDQWKSRRSSLASACDWPKS